MEPEQPAAFDAVMVVSFGGPEGPDEVLPFLEVVTAGSNIPPARLSEVAEQYMATGGASPINAANRKLVDELRRELARTGPDLPVYWGNRNWHPFIAEALEEMAADGVKRALAFVTSAYSSYPGCRAYLDAIERARAEVGDRAPAVEKIRQFWDHPGFIEPLRDGLREALGSLAPEERSAAQLVFVAHSIPIAMASTCEYEAQLLDATALVADAVAPELPRSLAWQSRSGPPQVPWLEPDVNDHLRHLAAEDVSTVIVVPIGFVSDHQEVVYDLDVRAAGTASELGLVFRRVRTPGTDGRFVAMVRELVQERLDPALERRGLGRLGIRPDRCAPGCCPAPAR